MCVKKTSVYSSEFRVQYALRRWVWVKFEIMRELHAQLMLCANLPIRYT